MTRGLASKDQGELPVSKNTDEGRNPTWLASQRPPAHTRHGPEKARLGTKASPVDLARSTPLEKPSRFEGTRRCGPLRGRDRYEDKRPRRAKGRKNLIGIV